MLAVALGFGSSLAWGLADFLGGIGSRRSGVLVVLAVSQACGLVGIALLVALVGGEAPSAADVWPAAAAGLAGVVALSAFYRALEIGTMSIVAPISSVAAAVPVAVGLATGERPSALQAAGIAAAVAGVVLASREQHDDEDRAAGARRSVLLALVAAAGFGTFFVGLDAAADTDVLWALLVARATSVAAVGTVVLARREPIRPGAGDLPMLAAIGLLDATANGLYAAATTEGLLSVVAVLGSLYPATTVILALLVLGERVRRVQQVGIVTAMAGVAFIAAG